MNVEDLGKKIADFRYRRNITIKEFADLTGISTALLSQLERGIGNPSLNVLSAISKTMNMPLAVLFEDVTQNSNLKMKKSERTTYKALENVNLETEVICVPPINVHVNVKRITLKPIGESQEFLIANERTEKIILMEKGCMEVIFENQTYHLEEGDTIRVISGTSYRFLNTKQEPSEFYVIDASCYMP